LTAPPSAAADPVRTGSTGHPEFGAEADPPRTSVRPGRAFLAVLGRDLFVTGRELPIFLAQVILQPFFFLFVFGRVLAELGYTTNGYSHLLFPGIVALTAFLTSLQTTALPLVFDFSYTKEIEDRLLAPMPVSWVALEKLVFAGIRSLIASVMMFPIGILVLGSIPWRAAGAPLFVVVLLLGTLVGATLGLTLGTLVEANRINIVFALVLTPVLFTGCSQYPWPSLHKLEWFQWLTTINPLTYVSEGMRAALVPGVPHIRTWVCLLMLVVSLAVFGTIGVKGFLRRAID
jgi:ABC-2 type transport system permease protein